jgi:hypothetical protein
MEKKQTHIMYGFISGLVMVILGVTIYLAGAAFIKGIQYVAYIPLLVGLILNAIAYSKANDGFVTFGNVFGSCFKAAMIVTIVMIEWTSVSPLIFPEMKEKDLSMMHDEMAKNKNIDDDKIDTYVNMFKNHWNMITIGIVILSNLIYGAIFSLIAAAIAQKKGPVPITSANF